MIKKARDLRPGDVVDGRKLIAIGRGITESYCHLRWGINRDDYLGILRDSDIWVDEEVPCDCGCRDMVCCEPFPERFVVKECHYKVLRATGQKFYIVDTDASHGHEVIGWWSDEINATSVTTYLNFLFAQRLRVVTKRADELRSNDRLVIHVDHTEYSSSYPRVRVFTIEDGSYLVLPKDQLVEVIEEVHID